MKKHGPKCESLFWDLLSGSSEQEEFKKYKLPIINIVNDGGYTFTFRWLLQLKDLLYTRARPSPLHVYETLAKVYFNRDLQIGAKSLLELHRTDSFSMITAIIQLIEQDNEQNH